MEAAGVDVAAIHLQPLADAAKKNVHRIPVRRQRHHVPQGLGDERLGLFGPNGAVAFDLPSRGELTTTIRELPFRFRKLLRQTANLPPKTRDLGFT